MYTNFIVNFSLIRGLCQCSENVSITKTYALYEVMKGSLKNLLRSYNIGIKVCLSNHSFWGFVCNICLSKEINEGVKKAEIPATRVTRSSSTKLQVQGEKEMQEEKEDEGKPPS